MSAETPHKYVHPLCYVCGSPAGRYRRRVNADFFVIKCTECGLEYTNPLPTEFELTEFYAQYHDLRANRTGNFKRVMQISRVHGCGDAGGLCTSK